MTTLEIATLDDAARALDHFNGFHDGFLLAVSLHSGDHFEREGPEITDIAHRLTGAFDVILEVAHYNYGEGTQPHDRVVLCAFEEVTGFHLDLREVDAQEWPLQELSIRPAKDGERLQLSWSRNRLVDGTWQRQTEPLFTFRRARFEESTTTN